MIHKILDLIAAWDLYTGNMKLMRHLSDLRLPQDLSHSGSLYAHLNSSRLLYPPCAHDTVTVDVPLLKYPSVATIW